MRSKKMPLTIVFVILTFLSAFGVGTDANNETTTIKPVACEDFKDCNACVKEKCHFVFTSCDDLTKNETTCMKDVPEKDSNCTIINEMNCSSISTSSFDNENTTANPETSSNGSITITTTAESTINSTESTSNNTSSSTISSTIASTESPTTKTETISSTTPIAPVTSSVAPVTSPTVAPTTLQTTNPSVETSPNSVTPTIHTGKTSGFDTGSFIGGIVLTLGLMAIAFVGYKFYRARTEHNYHTLLLMDSRPSYSSSPHPVV